MKYLLGVSAAAAVFAAVAAHAAATNVIPKAELCHNWGLSPADISQCETRMKAATSDSDIAKVHEAFNPNYHHTNGSIINPAADAKESLGSGAVRNTGATGTTGTNLPTVTDPDALGNTRDASEGLQKSADELQKK